MRKMEVVWCGGHEFEAANAEGAAFKMDYLKSRGGKGDGVTPVEALLAAAAGCSGIDLVNILGKMRIEFDSLEITADSRQAPEHPMYFTWIKFIYRIKGENLERSKIEKAIALSVDKYCSVKASISEECRFETELIIES
jgi:putative redox protein